MKPYHANSERLPSDSPLIPPWGAMALLNCLEMSVRYVTVVALLNPEIQAIRKHMKGKK